MDINSTKKNSKIAEEGEWVSDLPNMGDLRLKVRAANSRAVRMALAEKAGSDVENQKLENRERVTAEVMAETVLIDWDNLTLNGEAIPFDPKLALKWLLDPDFDDFNYAIETASIRVGQMSRDAVEKLAKN